MMNQRMGMGMGCMTHKLTVIHVQQMCVETKSTGNHGVCIPKIDANPQMIFSLKTNYIEVYPVIQSWTLRCEKLAQSVP